MSTRCLIGYVKEDGTIESIYCHHDGYLDGVGKTLKEHYQDLETIKKLMALGDLSTLACNPESNSELWTMNLLAQPKRWEELNNKYCCAYKDRGDDWKSIKPKTFESVEDYMNALQDCWGEYAYLFKNGVWEELVTGMKLISNSVENKFKEEMLELAGKLFAEKMYYAVSTGEAIEAVQQRNIQLIDSPNYKGVIDNAACQEIVGTIVDELLKRM